VTPATLGTVATLAGIPRLTMAGSRELPRSHIGGRGDHFVNPLGESYEIGIKGAQHHTSMRSPSAMELKKVTPIVRQEDSILRGGESQYLWIGDSGVRFPGVVRGQHVVAQPPEFHHHRESDVLVRIEPGH
jgi:hypothetical protein